MEIKKHSVKNVLININKNVFQVDVEIQEKYPIPY
jgi:hypothetical protein